MAIYTQGTHRTSHFGMLTMLGKMLFLSFFMEKKKLVDLCKESLKLSLGFGASMKSLSFSLTS
jgi:hypothetical protein